MTSFNRTITYQSYHVDYQPNLHVKESFMFGNTYIQSWAGAGLDKNMSIKMFYGPGGPYALFAGRDASRALALMSFDPKDLTGNIEGLAESELEALLDWELKFKEKYVQVGQLVGEKKKKKNEDEKTENRGNNIDNDTSLES